MPEIAYAIRIAVLRDALARTKEVGAYQAEYWLESHLKYLEIKEHERITQLGTYSGRTRNDR